MNNISVSQEEKELNNLKIENSNGKFNIPVINRNNPTGSTTVGRRPEWLKVRAPGGDKFAEIKKNDESKVFAHCL